jgi:hypothetical protein
VAFQGWQLPRLQDLIIKGNVNMTTFSNNTLPNLTTLIISNQSFTNSSNNSFPLLQELTLTGVPLNSLNYSSDPTQLLNLELTDTSPEPNSTFDTSPYPNLKELNLVANNYTGLLINNNTQLTIVVTSIPTLQNLIIRNAALTDISTIQNLTGL